MKLKALREEKKLSVPYLSFILNMSTDEYLRMEQGVGEIDVKTVYLLANAFGCSADHILDCVMDTTDVKKRNASYIKAHMQEFMTYCGVHAAKGYIQGVNAKGYVYGARIKGCPVETPTEEQIKSSSPVKKEDLKALSEMVTLFGKNGEEGRDVILSAMQDVFQSKEFITYLTYDRKSAGLGTLRFCELPTLTWFMASQMEKNYHLANSADAKEEPSTKKAQEKDHEKSTVQANNQLPHIPNVLPDTEAPDEDVRDETSDYYGRLS